MSKHQMNGVCHELKAVERKGDMRQAPAYFERHEIRGAEWYVRYWDSTGHERYRFFADVLPGILKTSEEEPMFAFCREVDGVIVNVLEDPQPFGHGTWGDGNPYFDAAGDLRPERIPPEDAGGDA